MPGSHKKKTLKDRLQKISSIAGEGKNLQDPDTYMIESYKRYKDRNKQLEKETTDAIKKYDEKHGTKTDVDKLEEGLKKRLDKVRKATLDDVTSQHKKKSKDKEKLLTKQGKGVAPNYNNPSKVKKKRLKGKVSKLKSRLAGLTHKKKSTQFPVKKDKAGKPLWNVDKSGVPITKTDRMKRYEHEGTAYQDVRGNQVTKEEYEKGGPNITDKDFGRAKGKSFGAKKAEDHEHSIQFKGYRGQFYKRASLVSTQGKFAKYWLLNAKQTNGNGWGVSQQSIAKNIHKFVGRPLVVTAKSWVPDSVYGDVYEHPYLPTNDIGQVLDHQEKYRVGNIVDIIEKNGDYYANIEINQKFAHMILPPFCSPAIFQNNPAEAEGQISDWEALHLAALHEDPAYGSRIALLRGTCVGTQDQCTIQFKSAKQEAKVICTKDLKGRLATLKKNENRSRLAGWAGVQTGTEANARPSAVVKKPKGKFEFNKKNIGSDLQLKSLEKIKDEAAVKNYVNEEEIEADLDRVQTQYITEENAKKYSKLKQRIAAVAPTTKINQKDGETIANAYDKMLHDPNNPAVKESYNALINETNAQFNELKKNGLRIDAIEDDSNPYQTADDLHNDLKKNNHIYYYPSEKGFGSSDNKFGDHPLLTESTSTYKGKKLLNNDVFRIVHDVNGHNLANSDFSPEGEHNAFLQHRKMYSPLANKALFTETAAQANWGSWNKKSGASNRQLMKEGRVNELVFADQKAGILSDDIVNTEWHTGETRTGKLRQRIGSFDINARLKKIKEDRQLRKKEYNKAHPIWALQDKQGRLHRRIQKLSTDIKHIEDINKGFTSPYTQKHGERLVALENSNPQEKLKKYNTKLEALRTKETQMIQDMMDGKIPTTEDAVEYIEARKTRTGKLKQKLANVDTENKLLKSMGRARKFKGKQFLTPSGVLTKPFGFHANALQDAGIENWHDVPGFLKKSGTVRLVSETNFQDGPFMKHLLKQRHDDEGGTYPDAYMELEAHTKMTPKQLNTIKKHLKKYGIHGRSLLIDDRTENYDNFKEIEKMVTKGTSSPARVPHKEPPRSVDQRTHTQNIIGEPLTEEQLRAGKLRQRLAGIQRTAYASIHNAKPVLDAFKNKKPLRFGEKIKGRKREYAFQTDGKTLYQNGYAIAEHTKNGIKYSYQGHPTPTTSDTARYLGIDTFTKNGVTYINGEVIDPYGFDYVEVPSSDISATPVKVNPNSKPIITEQTKQKNRDQEAFRLKAEREALKGNQDLVVQTKTKKEVLDHGSITPKEQSNINKITGVGKDKDETFATSYDHSLPAEKGGGIGGGIINRRMSGGAVPLSRKTHFEKHFPEKTIPKSFYNRFSKLEQRLGRLIKGKQRTAVMSKKVADIINSFKESGVSYKGIDGIWDAVEKRVLNANDEPDRERLWDTFGRRGMGFNSVTDTRGGPNDDLKLIADQLTKIEESGGNPALGFDSSYGGSLEAVDVTYGTIPEALSKLSPNQESIGYLDEDGKFTIEKNDRYTGKL